MTIARELRNRCKAVHLTPQKAAVTAGWYLFLWSQDSFSTDSDEPRDLLKVRRLRSMCNKEVTARRYGAVASVEKVG